jgi:adenosylcobyric acid synthase
LFDEGYRAIEARTGWRGYGVVPWLGEAARLPSEDAVVLERPASMSASGVAMVARPVTIACPITPRIANFDDLDPLRLEPGVVLVMVSPGTPIPEADLIILAGSKATIPDLGFLRAQGWDIDILAHHRRGKPVLGLCGGYQMLGRTIADPLGVEGPATTVLGLGLLDVDSVLTATKTLERVAGRAANAAFEGYEMHMGETTGPGTGRPAAHRADGSPEGATSADGLVSGSYVHGLLGLAEQRAVWLARIGAESVGPDHAASIDDALDAIAATLEQHLDLDAMLALSQRGGNAERE